MRHRIVRFLLVPTVAALAIVVLRDMSAADWARLAATGPDAWHRMPVEQTVFATLRIVGLIVAWWVLGTFVLYLAARAIGCADLLRGVTPRIARRAVDGLLAASLVVGGTSPALAAPSAPAAAATPQDASSATVRLRPQSGVYLPPGLVRPGPNAGQPPSGPDARPEPAPSAPRARGDQPRPGGHYVVAAGDHLWSIAERAVGQSSGDLVPYWRQLVKDVTPDLRSGDPDLILPGERLALPHWPPPTDGSARLPEEASG